MSNDSPKRGIETHRQGDALKQDFSQEFGAAGENLVTELIEAGRLNGGIDLSGNTVSDIGPMTGEFYPGVSYAHATGYYFMRRALGVMNADDAYDEFLLDVDAIDQMYRTNDVDGNYPDQRWMEKLCAPYFDRLEEIKNPKAAPGF